MERKVGHASCKDIQAAFDEAYAADQAEAEASVWVRGRKEGTDQVTPSSLKRRPRQRGVADGRGNADRRA